MKAILTEAVAVGNATARTIVFASRDPRQKFFPDRQWATGFLGGYAFFDNGERMLDGRTLFLYYATGITPAMAPSKPGVGSAYAYTARDSQGALSRRRQDLQGHAARTRPCRPLLVVHRL